MPSAMPGFTTSPLKSSKSGLQNDVPPSSPSLNIPEKGSCHQCRQMKLLSVVATCKALKKNKRCSMKFCEGCLSNRYGEKQKEVSLLDDWQCPKCRDICNCSLCRSKQGLKPTGILVHAARENGFTNVADLLCIKGPDIRSCESPAKEADGLAKGAKVLDQNEVSNNNLVDAASSKEGVCEKVVGTRVVNDPNAKKSTHAVRKKRKYSKKNLNGLLSNDVNNNDMVAEGEASGKSSKAKKVRTEVKTLEPEVELPKGKCLTTVDGIELLPEEVGDALQFLQFCKAFEEILDIKKGQARSIIRELVRGRSRNCGQFSSVVQIHVQLLSLIQKNAGKESLSMKGKNSWFLAIGELASQSQNLLKGFPLHCFDRGSDGYEMLSTTEKLKLLNYLCDEALNTDDLKLFIDYQNTLFIENVKKEREKANTARDKKNELKKKLRNEVAQALTGASSDPACTVNIEEAIAQLKREVGEAHAEMLEAVGTLSKKKNRSDALRTEPILLDDKGRKFWKLDGHTDEPAILLQDLGAWDAVIPQEKWFAYSAEQKEDMEKYLFSAREKRARASKVAGCSETDELESKELQYEMGSEESPQ